MLDDKLGGFFGQLAGLEPLQRLALVLQELLGPRIDQAAHRNDRETLIQLDRRQRIAGVGTDEGALEVRVRDALGRGGKARAKLGAGGPHFQIGQDRLTPAEPAGHENRHVAQVGQNFLRQHGQRNRANMPAGLAALDDNGVRPRAHQPLGQYQGGGKGDQLGAAILHRAHRGPGRDATGEHHMGHTGLQRHPHQVVDLRVHGDQVDAKGFFGERLGGGDLGGQHLRAHRAARDHAKAARIGNRRDQMTLADPAHRASQDGNLAAQEGAATRPEPVQFRAGGGARRCGNFGHAAIVPCLSLAMRLRGRRAIECVPNAE